MIMANGQAFGLPLGDCLLHYYARMHGSQIDFIRGNY
jgi:hypothetical protein